MRQTDAAVSLGISLTALKNACRRLGIRRWPYKRTPLPDRDSQPLCASHLADPGSCPSPRAQDVITTCWTWTGGRVCVETERLMDEAIAHASS
ncbi:hypothetical protein GUITHDRAFT_107146 [Guillardia theta CCMP2712]|uniref:RWP-RK domain-containing protein n=1 Tax=Guillardia theta (strain CCMP2712) TaxID=905079 RepID=L1JGL4_GUITC|nr:hypothetical protein GUITHDRAFT_107145 [Guillardia theta CCMP2712]XP_005834215.1 hypothetical protein GUITHDRAFT_107146 [Guillardia theta CCMP2712]EKX47234.1 hypothetical protein GUITHDRAFT_107145 [Guillardia theta CCMP2712]EKX47235.1 hypothetical protein GUITHDRAFT_107146 [Guillardia theta CCMP2712]|eukprot:XP_005834214.1 hypothetical protein GUITHDRAFT_107145 [Guillardia theta CCMP2712]